MASSIVEHVAADGQSGQQPDHAKTVDHAAALVLPFELPTPFYGILLALWHLRPDLQKRYPLHHQRRDDYLAYLGWCFVHGRREHQALRDHQGWNAALSRPAALPPLKGDRWGGTFSVGMYLAAIGRSQGRQLPILKRAKSRLRTFRWYWGGASQQLGMDIPAWQLDALSAAYGNDFSAFVEDLQSGRGVEPVDEDSMDAALTTIQSHFAAAELQQAKRPEGTEIPKVSMTLGEAFGMASPKLYGYWSFLRRQLRRPPSASVMQHMMQALPETARSRPEIRYPFGVNLFGYAHGELGIGEDVRMLALTLEKAGIPFCVINIKLGENVSQRDISATHWVAEEPRYGISVFCMTGIEFLRAYLEFGADSFQGRYTIGQWPWELPRWPESWEHCYSLVDEIWGISEFTSTSYKRAPVPVTTIPLPVIVEPVAERSRSDFGLPADDYLFVFSFDMLSTPTRKNPAGLIDAFHQAFPLDAPVSATGRVGLVLKINHAHSNRAEWRKLEQKIAHDPRIHLVEETLRRPDVLALYKCCNCFVSLHRSEGFGRSLVESLMLGLDVIATGYSGSMDYSQNDRVHTVGYQLVPVKEGEYFLPEGQHWAEPDLVDAARHMRELASVFASGKNSVPFDAYSPDVVSATYKRRLEQIYTEHTT